MIALALPALLVLAQPAEAAMEPDISRLAWLEGCWEGEGLGGDVGECWLRAPGSDRLTGLFFLSVNGEQRFSEIMVIDMFDDGPALRLKHFHADMTGWEEREDYVSFPLYETGDNYARFRGLDYRLTPDGTFEIDIVLRSRGEAHTYRLTLRRVER